MWSDKRYFFEILQNMTKVYTVKPLSRWCLIIDFELSPELYHVTFSRSEGDFVFNFKYLSTPYIVACEEVSQFNARIYN